MLDSDTLYKNIKMTYHEGINLSYFTNTPNVPIKSIYIDFIDETVTLDKISKIESSEDFKFWCLSEEGKEYLSSFNKNRFKK